MSLGEYSLAQNQALTLQKLREQGFPLAFSPEVETTQELIGSTAIDTVSADVPRSFNLQALLQSKVLGPVAPLIEQLLFERNQRKDK